MTHYYRKPSERKTERDKFLSRIKRLRWRVRLRIRKLFGECPRKKNDIRADQEVVKGIDQTLDLLQELAINLGNQPQPPNTGLNNQEKALSIIRWSQEVKERIDLFLKSKKESP